MSHGQFWYGNGTGFPGFLFKKNTGVGGRRSTKMNPGGNTTCNSYTYLYNKYKPGTGGVGASSTSNRRAKNRLATVCGDGVTIKKPNETSFSFTNATLSSNNVYNTIITYTSNGLLTIGSSTTALIIIVFNNLDPTVSYFLTLDAVTNSLIDLSLVPNAQSVSFSFNPIDTTTTSSPKCFPYYMTLGQYSNYTHNPNGFVPLV